MLWALDLATKTGECWGAANGPLPSLGHNTLPSTGDDVGRFIVAYREWFMPRLDLICPTLIVFEAPILPAATNLSTVRKLNGLASKTEEICTDEGIECREASNSEAKKALAGTGKATKQMMVNSARHYGLDPHTYTDKGEEASDEADAFGVWLATVRRRYPAAADRWDPINFLRSAS